MAKHRMRICIGYNDDGSAVEKMVSGNSQHELADKVVRAILNSERRSEFLEELGVANEDCPDKKPVPAFKDYAERWLTVYKTGRLKPKTLKGYQDKLKCQLYPTIGHIPITDLRVGDVQEMLEAHKELSHKSLQEALMLLRQILDCAVADGFLAANPAKDKRIYNPSSIRNERSALSLEDWQDIVNNLHRLEGYDRLYMALVVFTGMRRGEALGLRWEDIDFENNVIHVRCNVTHVSNKPIIGTPKTEKGKRDIPIIPGLLQYLVPAKENGFIVSKEAAPDEPITFSAYDSMWSRIKNTIDLHGATSHTFRHTLCTMLYENGEDIKTIQSVIGHADFKTTMDTYVHARGERKQAAMSRINDQIGA